MRRPGARSTRCRLAVGEVQHLGIGSVVEGVHRVSRIPHPRPVQLVDADQAHVPEEVRPGLLAEHDPREFPGALPSDQLGFEAAVVEIGEERRAHVHVFPREHEDEVVGLELVGTAVVQVEVMVAADPAVGRTIPHPAQRNLDLHHLVGLDRYGQRDLRSLQALHCGDARVAGGHGQLHHSRRVEEHAAALAVEVGRPPIGHEWMTRWTEDVEPRRRRFPVQGGPDANRSGRRPPIPLPDRHLLHGATRDGHAFQHHVLVGGGLAEVDAFAIGAEGRRQRQAGVHQVEARLRVGDVEEAEVPAVRARPVHDEGRAARTQRRSRHGGDGSAEKDAVVSLGASSAEAAAPAAASVGRALAIRRPQANLVASGLGQVQEPAIRRGSRAIGQAALSGEASGLIGAEVDLPEVEITLHGGGVVDRRSIPRKGGVQVQRGSVHEDSLVSRQDVDQHDGRVAGVVPHEDQLVVRRPRWSEVHLPAVGDAGCDPVLQVEGPDPAAGREGEGGPVRRGDGVHGTGNENRQVVALEIHVVTVAAHPRVAVRPLPVGIRRDDEGHGDRQQCRSAACSVLQGFPSVRNLSWTGLGLRRMVGFTQGREAKRRRVAGQPKISKRLEEYVDSETRFLAMSYVRGDRIKPEEVGDGVLRALAHGSRRTPYEVSVSVKGTAFSSNCDCPTASAGRICKHVYAAVVVAENLGVDGFRRQQIRQSGVVAEDPVGEGAALAPAAAWWARARARRRPRPTGRPAAGLRTWKSKASSGTKPRFASHWPTGGGGVTAR